jgi:uncharacterized protein (UPF0262 family)
MADNKLVDVTLDTRSIRRATPDIEHERDIAIYDLLEENEFAPANASGGPYKLQLSIAENRLVFNISDVETGPAGTFILSLSPLRKIIKDYFLICESYFSAIRTSAPSQIEAIDMGRRGLHDEGTQILLERLEGKVETNFETARRLFTLVCVLHWRG